MLLFLIVTAFLILVLFSFAFFLLISIFSGAPYVGTSDEKIKEILHAAKIKKGLKTLDLGSGDGRIVIAMAKKGAIATGFEINPFYVLLSKIKIYKAGVSKNASIYWKNFWREDISKFDIVTIYGVTYIMKKLEEKLKKEMKKGAKVISSSYTFKNWKPEKEKDFIFVYKISNSLKG